MISQVIESIHDLTANRLVTLYLMSSYLYYIHDVSPINDLVYDEICKQLLLKFKDIHHQHSSLINKDSLKAGTAYHLREVHYPLVVQTAAYAWRDTGAHLVYGFSSRRRRRSPVNVTEQGSVGFTKPRRRRNNV